MGWGLDNAQDRPQALHERRFQADMAETEVQRVVARYPHFPDPRTQTIEQLRFHSDRAYARAIAGPEMRRRLLVGEVESLAQQVASEARPQEAQQAEAQAADAQRMKAYKEILREQRAPFWGLTHDGVLAKAKEAERVEPRSGILIRMAQEAAEQEIERRNAERLDPFVTPEQHYGPIERAYI